MKVRGLRWLLPLISLTAAPLSAGTITFEPEQPTTQDVLRVVYHEESWNLACEPILHSVAVNDGQIVLTAVPPGPCILILTHNPYTFTVDVGPLPAGTYPVLVETVNGFYEPVTDTAEVTVSEAGTAPGTEPSSLGCVHGSRPGATLLLPYFELDYEDPDGRNTLFSVNNASPDTALAHVVLWTNWGIPVLSFDLALPGDGVRSLNLRDLLVNGNIPATTLSREDLARFSQCTSPVGVPTLAAPDREELRRRLTGRPDPPEICYSSPVEGGTVATGFVTVDVVKTCSASLLRHALSDGYFLDGGDGVASDENVLWGDYFLIDAAQDFAQGLELVSLVADERFGKEADTFYPVPESHRAPLGFRYRTRYLGGGAFDGGTELLVWTSSFDNMTTNCGTTAGPLQLVAAFRNEAGVPGPHFEIFHRNVTQRFRVGQDPWPVAGSFGTLDVTFGTTAHGLTEPFPVAVQGLVVPILSAAGRYSVGLNAAQVGGACP